MLIHKTDQIPADAAVLECHSCGTRYSGESLEYLTAYHELRCIEEGCGAGGFIARSTAKLTERFPGALASAFVPIPTALFDHRAALGIGPNELLVVMALERHRRALGQEVFPSQKTIAAMTGLSVRTVKRSVTVLVKAELVRRRLVYHGDSGRRASNRYDLDPLWAKLAAFDAEGQSDPWVAATAPETAPTGQSGPWTTGQNCHSPGATVAPEVEVKEEEALEKETPTGTDPAAPDPGEEELTTQIWDQIDAPDSRGADFAAFHAEHPKLNVLQAWAQYEEQNSSHEGVLSGSAAA